MPWYLEHLLPTAFGNASPVRDRISLRPPELSTNSAAPTGRKPPSDTAVYLGKQSPQFALGRV